MWKRTLGDYDGAGNCDGRVVYFGPGLRTRATSVPLADALGMDRDEVGVSDDADGWTMEGFE